MNSKKYLQELAQLFINKEEKKQTIFPIQPIEKDSRKPLTADDIFYTSKRSLNAGMQDIRTIAQNNWQEGAWFYSEDQKRWYNARAKHKTVFQDNLFSGLNIKNIGSSYFPQFGKNLTYIHTHNRSFITTFISERIKTHKISEEELRIAQAKLAVLVSLPSAGDIYYFCNITFIKNTKINFKIVSPYGCTTITISPKCISEYGEKKIIESFWNQANVLLDELKSVPRDIYPILISNFFQDLNQKTKPMIQLEFTPNKFAHNSSQNSK